MSVSFWLQKRFTLSWGIWDFVPPKQLSPQQEEFSFNFRWITYREKTDSGIECLKSSFISNVVPCSLTTSQSCVLQEQCLWWPAMLAMAGSPNLRPRQLLGWKHCGRTQSFRMFLPRHHPQRQGEGAGHHYNIKEASDSLLPWCRALRVTHTRCSWPPQLNFMFLKALSLICFEKSWNQTICTAVWKGKGKEQGVCFPSGLTFNNN